MQIYTIHDFLKYPMFAYTCALCGTYAWNVKPYNGGEIQRKSILQKIFFKYCLLCLFCQCCGSLAYLVLLNPSSPQSEDYKCDNSTLNCDTDSAVAKSLMDDLGVISETCALSLVHILAICKMYMFYTYRPRISALLMDFQAIFPTAQQQQLNEFPKLDYYARISEYMRLMIIFIIFGFTIYNCQPLLEIAHEWFMLGSDNIEYHFQENIWYPISEHTAIAFIGYIITYMMLLLGIILNNGFIVGAVFLLYFFTIQIQLQFDYLITSLESLDARDDERALLKLKGLIKRHLLLLRLSKEINEIFNLVFMANFISSALGLCLTAMSMVKLSISDTFRYSVLLIYLLMITAFICDCGNRYTDSNDRLHEAVFYSNWYESRNHVYRKMILIFMTRTSRCNELRAYNFYTVSMETLMSIVKFSYQLFAFFRTMG